VAAVAGVATVLLWGALSLQMAHGNDPALGPKARAAATSDRQADDPGYDGGNGDGYGDAYGQSQGSSSASGSGTTTPAPLSSGAS
jgi:hypothetical protein